MSPTRVIGIGSPHGDDQAGWRVAERLRADGVDAICLGKPVDLLEKLSGCRHLIVLDCCRFGLEPGTIEEFSWPDTRISKLAGTSSHGVGVGAALELAERLELLPSRVRVLAIEGAVSAPGDPMTPAVEVALDELRKRALAEIRNEP